jgi:hypothetical protein
MMKTAFYERLRIWQNVGQIDKSASIFAHPYKKRKQDPTRYLVVSTATLAARN